MNEVLRWLFYLKIKARLLDRKGLQALDLVAAHGGLSGGRREAKAGPGGPGAQGAEGQGGRRRSREDAVTGRAGSCRPHSGGECYCKCQGRGTKRCDVIFMALLHVRNGLS